jgi:hypothetical protein
MTRLLRLMGQGLAYLLFVIPIGYFASDPAHNPIEPTEAMITLSFTHAGKIMGECRQRTPEELAKLPPNMRQSTECPRERLPVYVELDGASRLTRTLRPAGFARDRASAIYARFPVASGRHRVSVRLRDSARTSGFDYQRTADIELKPRQNFVIDFRTDYGGFIFK